MEETPLSKLASELALCPTHKHHWELIHGSGHGILCALGYGGTLDRNARSQEVINFLADTNRFRGKEEAEVWFRTFLDVKNGKAVGDWLQWEFYPWDGQISSNNYEKWRKQADEQWPDCLKSNWALE